jgi:hypothetical protein
MDLIGQRVFSDKMAGLPHATIHEYSIFGVNKHGSKVVYAIQYTIYVMKKVWYDYQVYLRIFFRLINERRKIFMISFWGKMNLKHRSVHQSTPRKDKTDKKVVYINLPRCRLV